MWFEFLPSFLLQGLYLIYCIDHAKAHEYLIQSVGDERQSLHFTNPENPAEDYIVYMYKTGNPLKMDPGVSSKMYHYRDSYYFDCTRDPNSEIASVYLYDGRYPDEKYGIGHIAIEQFADDQNILSAMIPDAEALISALEKLNGSEEDNPFEM